MFEPPLERAADCELDIALWGVRLRSRINLNKKTPDLVRGLSCDEPGYVRPAEPLPPKEGKQQNERQRNSEQPEQRTSSKGDLCSPRVTQQLR